MVALRTGLVLAGLATALVEVSAMPSATAYADGSCWDSGDGSGCHWAEGNGWYGCFFAGAYSKWANVIAGAAVCQDGAEVKGGELN